MPTGFDPRRDCQANPPCYDWGKKKTEGLSGNFTVYKLEVDKDDMTLCISVDHRPSPWGDRYKYSLAHQRGMLTNTA